MAIRQVWIGNEPTSLTVFIIFILLLLHQNMNEKYFKKYYNDVLQIFKIFYSALEQLKKAKLYA